MNDFLLKLKNGEAYKGRVAKVLNSQGRGSKAAWKYAVPILNKMNILL